MSNDPLPPLARRLARACRYVIESVLYEWEVRDAEEEFFEVILAELKETRPREEQ